MKDLYILGAGGHAKEVYFLADRIGKWNIKGMLDINAGNALIISGKEVSVYDESIFDEIDCDNVCLVIGIAGSVKTLSKMVALYSRKFEFPNLIDPSVVYCKENIKIGVGNVIFPNNTITTAIEIGSYNILNIGSVIHHDVLIGDCNIFCPSINLSGGVNVGNSNYFGVKSTVLQYLKIGNDNIIGAASLVTKDLKNGITVMGVPAKNYKN
tara:strand:+ start:5013 stop:5645 length:633 start_codon:yes stop_codon:yes gene_type:complete